MKIRILFVSNLFPDQASPIRGLDNAQLLRTLRDQQEADIRVLCPRPHLALPRRSWIQPESDPEDASFDPYYVPVPYVPKWGSRWNDRLMEGALRRPFYEICQAFTPEVVLASWLFPDGCAAVRLAQAVGLSCVLIAQGSDVHRYLDDPIRRRKIVAAGEASEGVICRSADLAKRLKVAGLNASKPVTVYNGVDLNRFRSGGREAARRDLGFIEDETVFLFVGNLLPVKNPAFLLKAFARLASGKEIKINAEHAPSRLLLAGDGPLRNELASLALKLGISSQVEFLGRQAPERIATLLTAADALCLSSHNEGFPNVILEAMASGTPVISTDVGGIGERVRDRQDARLVPLGDLEGYAAALEAARNGDLRIAPKDGARATLGWPKAAADYLEILERALSAEPGKSEGNR